MPNKYQIIEAETKKRNTRGKRRIYGLQTYSLSLVNGAKPKGTDGKEINNRYFINFWISMDTTN